ncbi:polycystic kidney disease protein 1-like 2 [Amphiprion ocellaris]|uniref:polycystic kidney disease protein 1-like 2 n=1 Tax=Amphiprion ocellaris TaxID=80972 RepID=UPI0024110815|nr:polycystic kidney disease protein 1-like 2 [Amphiprion ocellaris]
MTNGRMCWVILHLLMLMTLSCRSSAENDTGVPVLCPKHQAAFRGSCFEFVGLQCSFFSAQAWCEVSGGHLAFIPDEDTQDFLQTHLDSEKDMWLGVAPSSSTNQQYSVTDEGPLSWLDGSPMTYSKWVSSPQQGAACGHIRRNSGFQWEATRDCNKKLHFICQFESGRSIVCAGRSTALQCGSGQVLMIDGGFYGRNNIHYCRSRFSPTTSTDQECGWVDVVESVTAHCQGRQICQIAEVINCFDEVCPQRKSYLSVDYHCRDGLTLTMNTVAAVFDDVTITVKWFIHLPQENLSCRLNTGDGQVVHLHSPEGLESSVVHKYTHPGTFVVAVECRGSEIRYQEIITIQEPVTEIGVIRCYAGNWSFYESNCKAQDGEAFQIQMEVNAGTNVVYRIQNGEKLLSGLSVVRGKVPQNITVTPGMMQHLGPGCHRLTLYASNMVTFPHVSRDLQVCILEKVARLHASILTERDDCSDSPDITLGVSLERGTPVLLLFSLTGDNSSFSETREMNTRKGIFLIEHPIQGPIKVKLRAQNVFSSLEVDVDMFTSCSEESAVEINALHADLLRFSKRTKEQHVRVARALLEIKATPSASMSTRAKVTLSATGSSDKLDNDNYRYEWECKKPCQCKKKLKGEIYVIKDSCLPEPFHFNKYHFKLKKNNGNSDNDKDRDSDSNRDKDSDSKRDSDSDSKRDKDSDSNRDKDSDSKRDSDSDSKRDKDSDSDSKRDSDSDSDSNKRKRRRRDDDNSKGKDDSQSICITLTPAEIAPWSLTCFEGCNQAEKSKDAKIKMECDGQCPEVLWNIEDPRDDKDWEKETRECYKEANQRPLIRRQDGGIDYTVKSSDIKKANGDDVIVVVATKDTTPVYKKYTLKTSGDDTTTTKKPATTDTSAGAGNTQDQTTNNSDGLSCNISPSSGTVLDPFTITCNTEKPCPNCQYCLTAMGKHLRCSETSEVKAVFLPLGDSSASYNLVITATAETGSFAVKTTITTQVRDSKDNSGFSVDDLKNAVINTVDQLKNQDLLSGEIIGQMFSSVANTLNGQSDESQKEERQQLRKTMLDMLVDTVKTSGLTPLDIEVMARALNALIKEGTELSLSSQEEASSSFVDLSSSLLLMVADKSEKNKREVHSAASAIVVGISCMMDYSSTRAVSDALFSALDKVQSILLAFQEANREPGIIQQGHISVFVNRRTPKELHTQPINIPNSICSAFSLPALPSETFVSEEPVDVRMLSLDKVPFPLNEGGNVSGVVGDLSLTTKNGSGIHVENLSEDIEILLPRPAGEQVNTSVLYLGNYSTTVIDVPSGNTTLVLKMVPSMEPLPFKVFLGYMEYPTEANHVAMTQMPQEGTTKEERYTWLLSPESLKGHTGTHYLVVRPIVGPGIKSINASLSITSITASCKYWNESLSAWYDHGCRVGVNTTHSATQCLCNHLTFFGSSFFVTPNLVDPSRTAELFATFAENPVVVCFVGALFVTYLLVVVWARRKDIQDTAKVKVTVLADNDPMDEYRYLLSVCTGHRVGASTSSQVTVTLLGAEGNSEPHHLTDPKKPVFERGGVDMFLITTPFCLGDLQSLRLWHNNSGSHPSWYVGNVIVQDFQTEQKWHFLCNSWLAIDMEDCCLDKVFPASTEEDLKRFSNLFFMKTTKDFSDGHLWFSVVNRPVSSTFTRVQRVSCCFSLLLCTMLTSIMFYGIPTDPSEQTMDLGHFEFTWQQFMIGVQSSLIMFPVNILIVSIFRNTRPREMSCCRRQTKKPKALEQDSSTQKLSSHAATPNMNANDTLDTIIKDITRIAHTLSKNVKSNIPCTESDFKPEQQIDINAILPVMEDFIKQNNKSSDNVQAKTQPQLPESSASVHPAQTEKGIQKKSNKIQYLYRQLCHIELSLQSLSSFPSPHSYSQALQQVQALKGVLEEQLFTSNSVVQDDLINNKLSPADISDDDGIQNKRVCCQGMLPWWFIFVGWLLVIGTSVVSGYFTMLYGLNFGKERSISWLVSMIVSFFQSLLLIQPLKVLCIAIFFALVIKKVDEEDFQNVAFVKSDCKDQQMTRRDAGLYVPPPPADIEKMRRNRILEQKAFALLREILIYMGFLWMLLLVAYGQRDPNAFLLNKHIRKSFSAGISSSMSVGDVFAWANKSLLRNLYGVYPGFITDGNSKLVGNARLRQLRVQKSSCQIADSMLKLVPDCHAPYSWEVEDMGSYELGWNHSVSDNMSTSTSSPWKYQTQAQLRSSSFWGKTVIYRGGGFSVELGPDLQNASSTLEYLFRNKWLDMYTRAVFVEFTVYNANVNLFCVATLLLETTAVGAFQFQSQMQSVRLYQSTGGLYIFVMVAEIIYLLFILHYMFLQGKLMKQQRCSYFKNKWNLLELTIILLSWSALAVFIVRNVLGDRDITYYQNHKDQFVSFLQTATVDSLLQYLIAFLVLLATVKMWHLLRLNPKMNMITATLQRAWSDISDFLVVIVIMLAAYSIACNVIYGWEISSYKTLMDAVLTIISLQIGIFNYNEVLNYSPVLGGFLIGSCIVFMSFVVLNLLVSVILVAFNQEQIYHKPSEEEESVDLLLKKICSLFGIRYEDTNDSPGPDVNGSSGSTLNNSRNIHNTPSVDVNIFQTSDNKVNPEGHSLI